MKKPTRRSALALAAVAALALTGCGSSDPLGGQDTASGSPSATGGTGGSGDALVIGSQQYYSNEIIAELYAQALEAEGYTVERDYQIGQREVYLPEVESGAIDVMPEYGGNLLQYYDAEATATSPEDIQAALAEVLPQGLRPLEPAEATDQDSYNVTRAFAEKHSLTSLADLKNVDEPLKVAANSEFETRPYGPAGLKEAYGVDVTVVPVEDSGGPLTVKALVDGDVQLADIYSADPSIAAEDLVTLEDPENLILPQNVTPIASEAVDEEAAAIIEKVNAKLTPEALIGLNRESVEKEASSEDIAQAWLAGQGLS
ncbi:MULTISPECIES: ABC transporter substrate-binding protein [Micrococcaceae]|uniref:ABC transporter substrate-binding protein n=1 Tax=Micrococcaceae TaxID=1268 RepID=UPI00161D58D1|nr:MULTISPECIES: ABC transporter substrate-binding protein [Micrococcaceae]MBB5747855.1 osmoprotectant transport system substrate-binding protein [Micrococcus sp. TA1]HRO30072.1 ABC transporter substrate-binding protein [Citricoccus sp.]HRO94561.1 ABC transporter substrate-binding protein [Citricoccus sp.]